MGWYTVTKKIKGIPYLYRQRTWRSGGQVKTESVYLGRADGGGRVGTIRVTSKDPDEAQSIQIGVNTTRVAFHGARDGFSGSPKASEEGNLGAGFYLTTRERAERFRQWDPKIASDLPKLANPPAPQHDGELVVFDIKNLNIKRVIGWQGWFDLGDELLEVDKGFITDEDMEVIRKKLEAQGYDGIEIIDRKEPEMVIFPKSLKKLK